MAKLIEYDMEARSTLKKGLVPTLYTPGNNDSGTLKQITTGTLKTGRPWQ